MDAHRPRNVGSLVHAALRVAGGAVALVALVLSSGCVGDVDFDAIEPRCDAPGFDLASRAAYCSGATAARAPVVLDTEALVGLDSAPDLSTVGMVSAAYTEPLEFGFGPITLVDTLTLSTQQGPNVASIPAQAPASLDLDDAGRSAWAQALRNPPVRTRLLDPRANLTLLEHQGSVSILQQRDGAIVNDPSAHLLAHRLLAPARFNPLLETFEPSFPRITTRTSNNGDTLWVYLTAFEAGFKTLKLTWSADQGVWALNGGVMPPALTPHARALCNDACVENPSDNPDLDSAFGAIGSCTSCSATLGCSRCASCNESLGVLDPECRAFCASLEEVGQAPAQDICESTLPEVAARLAPAVCGSCDQCDPDAPPGNPNSQEICQRQCGVFADALGFGTPTEMCGSITNAQAMLYCEACNMCDPRASLTPLCASICGGFGQDPFASCAVAARSGTLARDVCGACDRCSPNNDARSGAACGIACYAYDALLSNSLNPNTFEPERSEEFCDDALDDSDTRHGVCLACSACDLSQPDLPVWCISACNDIDPDTSYAECVRLTAPIRASICSACNGCNSDAGLSPSCGQACAAFAAEVGAPDAVGVCNGLSGDTSMFALCNACGNCSAAGRAEDDDCDRACAAYDAYTGGGDNTYTMCTEVPATPEATCALAASGTTASLLERESSGDDTLEGLKACVVASGCAEGRSTCAVDDVCDQCNGCAPDRPSTSLCDAFCAVETFQNICTARRNAPPAPLCASERPDTDAACLGACQDTCAARAEDGATVVFPAVVGGTREALISVAVGTRGPGSDDDTLFFGGVGKILQLAPTGTLDDLDPDAFSASIQARAETLGLPPSRLSSSQYNDLFTLDAFTWSAIDLPSLQLASGADLLAADMLIRGNQLHVLILRDGIFAGITDDALGDAYLVTYTLAADGTIDRDADVNDIELDLALPEGDDLVVFPGFSHLMDLGGGLIGVRVNLYGLPRGCFSGSDPLSCLNLEPSGYLRVFDIAHGGEPLPLPIDALDAPPRTAGAFNLTELASTYDAATSTATVLVPRDGALEGLDITLSGAPQPVP